MATNLQQLQPAWLNAQCPREGRYVIGPLLGRGGMGNVHEAWDVVLCRTVALKILKDVEPAALIRFMHEAQIHARVVHPNICRIYDVDNYEGTLRVAMQLVPGSNLEQAYVELSGAEVVTIMALVAQAVHVVHRLKLIHRDLKPSNILLEHTAEGQWIPYVCDFGLAMALDEPALTYSHAVQGTPAYMAPEQFRGDRGQISAATDVYALGGTLHYALTGHPPGSLPRTKGMTHRIALDQRIPRGLRTIIGKCLEPDPEQRYPSANALAEDLWRFREGDPIRASNRKVLSRLGRLGRKRLTQLRPCLVGAAVAILILAGLAAYQQHFQGLYRQHMALAQQVALEAEAMAATIRLERMLPIHDMRPAYARVRGSMAFDRARMPALGSEGQGQGHFALGCAAYQIHDFPSAQVHLEQAWNKGFQGPEVASLRAEASIASARQLAQPSPVQKDPRPPRQDPGLVRNDNEYAQSLAAFLRQDYVKGAASANAQFLANPWHYEAAALASACTTALARQSLEAGNLPTAKCHFQKAMAIAWKALAVGQSDQTLYDTYFQAARGLSTVNQEWGQLSLAMFPDLQAACDRALRIDPDDPALQDDWLAFRWLKAMRMIALGMDPGPDLDAAMAFLATWTKDPLTVALRADRMMIYWQAAEWDFARGRNPDSALTEALKTSGHTPFLGHDYLWDVLNFKARVDAARGVDPRPTLAGAMAHLQPLLQEGGSWSLRETSADSWLIQAQWEMSHGQDAGVSIRNARVLAQSARNQNPNSAGAYALEGLAALLERPGSPGKQAQLLAQAKERLKRSLASGSGERHQTLLKEAVEKQAETKPAGPSQ